MIDTVKVLYFDVETTGTDSRRHGLIQLGQIIEVDGRAIREDVWDIQPFLDDVIEDEALKVSGTSRDDLFSDRRLKPADAWREIQASWDGVINKYDRSDKFVLGGYNVDSFDQGFLREFVRKAAPSARFSVAGSYLGHLTIDPLPYLKWLKALGVLTVDDLKLATVCNALGIPLDKAHDAMSDIRATRWLIRRVRRDILQSRQAMTMVNESPAGVTMFDLAEPMDDEPVVVIPQPAVEAPDDITKRPADANACLNVVGVNCPACGTQMEWARVGDCDRPWCPNCCDKPPTEEGVTDGEGDDHR